MKKKLIFLGAIFAVVGLLVGAYFLFAMPKRLGEGEKTITLEIVMKDRADAQILQVKTDGDFVIDMLMQIADEIDFEYENSPWGTDIKGFFGINVGNEELYYAFYINGEYSMVGCDTAPLSDGDIISFKLTGWNEAPDGASVDKTWIFVEIVGVLACMGLMAYMIVKDEN